MKPSGGRIEEKVGGRPKAQNNFFFLFLLKRGFFLFFELSSAISEIIEIKEV